MRLAFATSEFKYAGRPRSGFPLLLGDDMAPIEPLHAFLRWLLLERGKLLKVKTWENYGRYLWDFACFLAFNGFVWNEPFAAHGDSVVSIYRDWQAHDLDLEAGTINQRLRLITRFYCWAFERGLLDQLPFSYSDVTVYGVIDDLSHVTGGTQIVRRADVLLDEWEKEPVFLIAEQVKVARAAIRSTSQRLLFDLMARVGLRSIEARTFPLRAVFDPTTRPDIKSGTLIEVELDPRYMEVKFDKSRVVHVPYSLMEDMYAYSQFERNRYIVSDRNQPTLLLTIHGNAYSKGSAHKAMADLGRKVGFRVSPLMLRHTYAIYTLLVLRANPQIKLEPLMYVRDRLGHKSVVMTMTYLRQIERLLGAEALSMMAEFDKLYEVTPGLHTFADSQPIQSQ